MQKNRYYALGILGMTAIVGSAFLQKERKILAGEWVEYFSTQPRWVIEDRYIVPDAQQVLVHAKMVHVNTKEELDDLSPEDLQEVVDVQGDIYVLGKDMHTKGLVKKLFDEAKVTSGSYRGVNAEKMNEKDPAVPLYFEAGRRLENEGYMDRYAAEKLEVVVDATLAIMGAENTRNETEAMWDKVNKKREDASLVLFYESGESSIFLLEGGDHNFLDNVIEWNLKHPDQKFSLLGVKPVSYKTPSENYKASLK
ncbi:MAG: hypothetical protein Q7R96_00435 [Nanoarchaeota archaeon]|nr:hypothetical protein [Nanoarchaeota archaeon]